MHGQEISIRRVKSAILRVVYNYIYKLKSLPQPQPHLALGERRHKVVHYIVRSMFEMPQDIRNGHLCSIV